MRTSAQSYTDFIHKHRNDCLVLVVYVAEAHFVERGDSDEFVDGWPIGYSEFEYPQHKSILDRMKMASIAMSGHLTFMREADHILCDDMNNTFLNTMGAWPDGAYALIGQTLVFKGKIDGGVMYGGGYRKTLFSEQLDVFLNDNKY